jgi:hypothetical protein
MHFSGRVVGWLQAVGRRVRFLSWSEFCAQIHSHFGHDQHQSLIRRLFHIRQTGSVVEYVEQFSVLVDHQSAYEDNADPLYYTMCFIDGLHDDIKSVIMVQRPSTLDTACSLVLVQEEALASGRWQCGASSNHRSLLPHYGFQSGSPKWGQPPDSHKTSSAEDKLDVLRRFRRARGLCEKCAEK